MTKQLLVLLGVLTVPAVGMAANTPKYNWPTRERVELVFNCMHHHGGENYTTLYKCSCMVDQMADKLPYNRYVILQTYKRGQHSHGERPEVLREGKLAHDSRAKLAKITRAAQAYCLLSAQGKGGGQSGASQHQPKSGASESKPAKGSKHKPGPSANG